MSILSGSRAARVPHVAEDVAALLRSVTTTLFEVVNNFVCIHNRMPNSLTSKAHFTSKKLRMRVRKVNVMGNTNANTLIPGLLA